MGGKPDLGWPFGIELLEQGLKTLEETLLNYYGAITEIRNNRKVPVPDMPESAILAEQIQQTGHLYFDGGLADQPYLFMKEIKVCIDIRDLFRRQWEVADREIKNGSSQ